MLQEIEELSPTTRRLKINVPSEVIQSETDTAYNELGATTKIPGFRQGKVPRAILVKRFGKDVEAKIMEKIVPRFYLEAVKEANLDPVTYPSIDEKIEIKPGEPLSFTVTVEIKPVISELNYGGITLKEKNVTVEDAEVDKAINGLRESKALYSVMEEPLKEGDMGILTSEAYIDGELRDELSYKEFPFLVGTDSMPKEYSDALIGKKKGETAEVTIHFEDNNPNQTLAGKDVLFKMSVEETKKKNLPPIDEEFAKDAGCEDPEDLKNKIRENLAQRKENQINLEYKREILDELVKRHDFEVPPSMLQGEIDSMIEQEKQNAARQGQAPAKTDEEMKREFEPRARDNVKGVILLETIGKKENIEVTDDDLKEAMEEIAARNDLKVEELKKLYAMREGSLDALKSRLFADKVLEFILGSATFEK